MSGARFRRMQRSSVASGWVVPPWRPVGEGGRRDLGVSAQSLRNWRGRSADEGRAGRSDHEEREELRRLRRENRTLVEEREILKKAAAFFARDTEHRRVIFRLIAA